MISASVRRRTERAILDRASVLIGCRYSRLEPHVITPERQSRPAKPEKKSSSQVGYSSEIGVFESFVLTVIRAVGATRPRRVDAQLDGSRRITSGPSVSIERCNLPADLVRVFIGILCC
jgi:hypothetical protein